MQLTDIKKLLYKEKMLAVIINVSKDGIFYSTRINNGSDIKEDKWDVTFLVPLSDIGDAKFEHSISSQFLIRWILSFTPSSI